MVPTKDLRIKYVPIGDVHPYEDNPRRNDGAVQAVANSLREFGWKQPIVVDADGTIVVGHARYKAALALGMAEIDALPDPEAEASPLDAAKRKRGGA